MLFFRSKSVVVADLAKNVEVKSLLTSNIPEKLPLILVPFYRVEFLPLHVETAVKLHWFPQIGDHGSAHICQFQAVCWTTWKLQWFVVKTSNVYLRGNDIKILMDTLSALLSIFYAGAAAGTERIPYNKSGSVRTTASSLDRDVWVSDNKGF